MQLADNAYEKAAAAVGEAARESESYKKALGEAKERIGRMDIYRPSEKLSKNKIGLRDLLNNALTEEEAQIVEIVAEEEEEFGSASEMAIRIAEAPDLDTAARIEAEKAAHMLTIDPYSAIPSDTAWFYTNESADFVAMESVLLKDVDSLSRQGGGEKGGGNRRGKGVDMRRFHPRRA